MTESECFVQTSFDPGFPGFEPAIPQMLGYTSQPSYPPTQLPEERLL